MQMQTFIFWYKNAPYGYVMMWMPPCGCAMMQIIPCGYVTMQMLFIWCKWNLTKKKLFSKSRLPRSLESKCFQNSIYFFQKLFSLFWWGLNAQCIIPAQKHILFWLKVPQKLVINVKNLRMRYHIEIGWSGSKKFISSVRLRKGVEGFQGLFSKTRIFWKSDILKNSFFQSMNMIIWSSVETHCDNFE